MSDATLKPPRKRRKLVLIVGGILAALLLCVVVAALSNSGNETQQASNKPSTIAVAEKAPAKPTKTPIPSKTPKLTNTPKPTNTPTDTPVPTPIPEPVDLSGSGQTATDPITLPAPLCVAHFTHKGQSNFAVKVYQGDDWDLLINEIGPYDGARPLAGSQPVILDIDADGAWTVHIEPITMGNTAAFSGKGDAVSPLFSPPATGAWEFYHDGKSNFAVWLHCAGGSDLIQNEIGAVDGSTIIRFSKGPCFWEVEADGNWSLKPRE